jgi:hypothetical protein
VILEYVSFLSADRGYYSYPKIPLPSGNGRKASMNIADEGNYCLQQSARWFKVTSSTTHRTALDHRQERWSMKRHDTVTLFVVECSGVIGPMQIDNSLADIQRKVCLLKHVSNSEKERHD